MLLICRRPTNRHQCPHSPRAHGSRRSNTRRRRRQGGRRALRCITDRIRLRIITPTLLPPPPPQQRHPHWTPGFRRMGRSGRTGTKRRRQLRLQVPARCRALPHRLRPAIETMSRPRGWRRRCRIPPHSRQTFLRFRLLHLCGRRPRRRCVCLSIGDATVMTVKRLETWNGVASVSEREL